ncbi:MAG TPA: hypothetical protein VD735_05460 [Candidatus Saccharimonadales bacterium]|nr:hypothetical protein [Candidatus Saccharimonadales bacterium]
MYIRSPANLLAIADNLQTTPEHRAKIANNVVASMLGWQATAGMVAIGNEVVANHPFAGTFLAVSAAITGVVSGVRYDLACEGAKDAIAGWG